MMTNWCVCVSYDLDVMREEEDGECLGGVVVVVGAAAQSDKKNAVGDMTPEDFLFCQSFSLRLGIERESPGRRAFCRSINNKKEKKTFDKSRCAIKIGGGFQFDPNVLTRTK